MVNYLQGEEKHDDCENLDLSEQGDEVGQPRPVYLDQVEKGAS